MGKLRQQLTEPLSSVSDRPFHFVAWCVAAICLGSAGFWLPILLLWGGGGSAYETFTVLVYAGSLASFSVVLLSDGVAATLVAVGTGSNIAAAGMRGLIGCIAFLLALVHVGVLSVAHGASGESRISVGLQVFLTALAVILAAYLYCFRFPSWEKDVAEVVKNEYNEVKDLGKSAEKKHTDDGGARL